jgi:hypothetical protein
MADKPKATQDRQSALDKLLSGLRGYFNVGDAADFPQGQYPSLLHPDYASFNERFTRTPGVVKPAGSFSAGVDGQYVAGGPGFPGDPANLPRTIYIGGCELKHDLMKQRTRSTIRRPVQVGIEARGPDEPYDCGYAQFILALSESNCARSERFDG